VSQSLIEVYTDGSGTTLDLPGGWAFVIHQDGVKIYEESGGLAKATNNEAEITAAINGLNYASTIPGIDAASVVLVSDSQLVLGYASGAYKCKAYNLVPLYIKLRKAYNDVKASQRWVRGHTGDPGNERCDELAKAERDKLISTKNVARESGKRSN
jgi:ribonuclease HI